MNPSVDRLWGCRDLEAVFGGKLKVVLPWPSAVRRRDGDPDRRQALDALLATPPNLVEIDPRILLATQTWVIRYHASYYLSGRWERIGTTSADMISAANRYPIVAVQEDGTHTIITGHHRSLAALIEGRPLLARSTAAPGNADTTVVTPNLWVTPHTVGGRARSQVEVADGLVAGRPIVVKDMGTADDVLTMLGLDSHQREDRIEMGRSGQVLLGR